MNKKVSSFRGSQVRLEVGILIVKKDNARKKVGIVKVGGPLLRAHNILLKRFP